LLIDSMAMHVREEKLSKEIGDEHSRVYSLLNQANLLREMERLEGAKALLVGAERIFRKLCDWDGVQQALGGLANIACCKGRYREARKYSDRQRRICQELGDPNAIQQSYLSYANILQFDEDFDAAADILRKHEELCVATANLAGLARGKAIKAFLHYNTNSLNEARIAAKEASRLALDSGDSNLQLELENKLKQFL
jgi:hypothetical protein